MNVIFPIYKKWNRMFHEDQIMGNSMRNSCKKWLHYKKPFEFKHILPIQLEEGDKVYVYEPKKHGGCGQVVGHFTVGPIFKCDYAFGAYPFIVYFCRNVLQNEEFAKKFEKAFKVELNGYKKGYIMKWALDDESMDDIKKYGVPPDIVDYLYDKERTTNLELSEDVWKLCDEWLGKIGFFNDCGESFYKHAITVQDYVIYDTPIPITSFTRPDGTAVSSAPQSFMYVQDLPAER